MPTFGRTIISETAAMGWLVSVLNIPRRCQKLDTNPNFPFKDVAASVGGYFSFVQALSWLLSGQAGAT